MCQTCRAVIFLESGDGESETPECANFYYDMVVPSEAGFISYVHPPLKRLRSETQRWKDKLNIVF